VIYIRTFIISIFLSVSLTLLVGLLIDWEVAVEIIGGIGILSWLIAGIFSGAFISGDRTRAINSMETAEDKKDRTKYSLVLFLFGLPFLLSALIVYMGGHNKPTIKDVSSIKLECIQLCMQKEERPFEEKQFKDKDSITLFIQAIHESKKMQGVLDYGAIFLMTVNFTDGNENTYHLNIENIEDPQKGLLLMLPNTEQGYEIPEGISKDLRDLIYQK